MTNVEKTSLPSFVSKAAQQQVAPTALVRDLWHGAQRVRDRGELYLPKDPGESDADYQARLKRSVFTNFFRKAVEGLVGLVFRKDPVLGVDVPTRIRKDWETIDASGKHGDVFARELMQDAVAAGHSAFLVEYPKMGVDRPTLADEVGVQPYWVPLKKEQFLSWRTTVESARTVLTQLVVEEIVMVPDGQYGEKAETRYRVFTRTGAGEAAVVTVRVYVIENNTAVEKPDLAGTYPTQTEIPVVEVPSSGAVSLFESDPPLLDLAHLNLAHYQVRSDFHQSIHKTCVPIWVETGVPAPEGEGEVVLGASAGRSFTNENADARYVSHDGASLGSVKQALDDLKDEIGTMGLAMLAPQKRVAETAEAKRLDKSVGDSALAVSARALQDALERGLDFHAKYYKLPDGGSVTINRDFEHPLMDAAVMSAYVDAAARVGFPLRALLREWQAGGRLPEDVDLDELEAEMIGAQAALAEERRAEAERQQSQGDGFGKAA